RLQNNNPRWLLGFFRACRAQIKNRRSSLLGFVEPFSPARQNFFNQRWQRTRFFLHLRGKRVQTERVHHFEWPQLPTKPPAHRAIHVYEVVRNFRQTSRRIQASLRKRSPQELLRLVALLPFQNRPYQRAKPLLRVINCFSRLQRCKSRFLPCAIFHCVHIQRQNFFFSLAFHFFVKSLALFISQSSVSLHFFHQHRPSVALARLIFSRAFIY